MSGQTQDSRDEIATSIRLPREQHEQLRELAAREHRTLSGELRRLVEQRLAEAGHGTGA